jgi:O-antigen ligase
MPGRPNGTFAEPDWLGFFTVTLLVLASAALYRAIKDGEQGGTLRLPRIFSLASLLIPISMVLILTVSRSAWLAALVALSVWTVTVLVIQGRTVLRPLLQTTELAVIAFGLALFIVVDIPLTRFDLLNRAESTATGFQEITVACETFVALPTQIGGVEELSTYGCWHINLEERATLEAAGRSIQLTHRPDPNIVIRSEIYRKTWTEIRTHLVFGIGWGNIGDVLGRDEHGAAYNASNVWLEVALGAGLLGLVGLAGALGSILWRGVQLIPRLSTDDQVAAASVPIAFSILAAFLVFNLFNAGLLIGFVWVFLAMIPTLLPSTGKKI